MPVRLLSILLFVAASAQSVAATDCGQLKACEKKFCEIESQLAVARQKGNKNKIAGLEKSLKNARDNCTEQSLRDDLAKDIKDAKSDIVDYEKDLKEAEKDGKPEKVAKYRGKIQEEQQKIDALEKELSALK